MSEAQDIGLRLNQMVEFFPNPEEDIVSRAIYVGKVSDTKRLKFLARDRREAERILELHMVGSKISIQHGEGEYPLVYYQGSVYSDHDVIEINAGSNERAYNNLDKILKKMGL